jgi:hypothetical protein
MALDGLRELAGRRESLRGILRGRAETDLVELGRDVAC